MFNIFHKNKKVKNSKTKNLLLDVICFSDLKDNILQLKDRDEYTVIDINGSECYFNREQLKFLSDIFNKISAGDSIQKIVKYINKEEE